MSSSQALRFETPDTDLDVVLRLCLAMFKTAKLGGYCRARDNSFLYKTFDGDFEFISGLYRITCKAALVYSYQLSGKYEYNFVIQTPNSEYFFTKVNTAICIDERTNDKRVGGTINVPVGDFNRIDFFNYEMKHDFSLNVNKDMLFDMIELSNFFK